jgi:hypothetical protein
MARIERLGIPLLDHFRVELPASDFISAVRGGVGGADGVGHGPAILDHGRHLVGIDHQRLLSLFTLHTRYRTRGRRPRRYSPQATGWRISTARSYAGSHQLANENLWPAAKLEDFFFKQEGSVTGKLGKAMGFSQGHRVWTCRGGFSRRLGVSRRLKPPLLDALAQTQLPWDSAPKLLPEIQSVHEKRPGKPGLSVPPRGVEPLSSG